MDQYTSTSILSVMMTMMIIKRKLERKKKNIKKNCYLQLSKLSQRLLYQLILTL